MIDIDALERERDVAGLIAALGDAHWGTRAGSARALGRLDAREAIAPLALALHDGEFYDPTENAENREQLREWAIEQVYPVREAAQEALRQILTSERGSMPDTFALKKAADVPGLIGALAYGRDDAASAALQQIDDPDVAALVRELEDDAWRCRQRAAQALAILYDPRGAEPLGAALRDPEPLTTALRDPRADVRIAAIGALVSCSGPLAVEPIIGALGDESSRVRAEAAWELGALRDPRALEPLIAALQDYYPDVRRNAVWALGMIGGARAVEALSLQRGDHDAGVRERVEKALADLASTSV